MCSPPRIGGRSQLPSQEQGSIHLRLAFEQGGVGLHLHPAARSPASQRREFRQMLLELCRGPRGWRDGRLLRHTKIPVSPNPNPVVNAATQCRICFALRVRRVRVRVKRESSTHTSSPDGPPLSLSLLGRDCSLPNGVVDIQVAGPVWIRFHSDGSLGNG